MVPGEYRIRRCRAGYSRAATNGDQSRTIMFRGKHGLPIYCSWENEATIKQRGRLSETNYKPQVRMFFYQAALLAYKVVPAATVIGRVISG